MNEIRQENKMGVMPVGKLLINMSLPVMVSMIVQALYNIVDSIFVARIEEKALTAVSLAFPIQSLLIALAVGTGVGANALISRFLGEKEYEKANKVAGNSVFLAFLGYLLFVLIGLFAAGPFYRSQTSDAVIVEYGTQYLTIVCTLSLGVFMQCMFEKLLQSTGRTLQVMFMQATGAIINMILDPIMIFGLLGMPAMGVRGAAIATVTGQSVAGLMGILMNHFINKDLQLDMRGFRPDKKVIGEIYRIGVPSIIMQGIGSVMTYGMNRILITFTDTATAVFGVYFKLQSFIFMPIFGLNSGIIPIVAYNYGAGRKKRVTDTIKIAWAVAIGIMCFGLVLMETFPAQMLGMFDASEHMLSIGIPALRIIAVHFPIAGYCIVTGSVFQALGRATYGMVNSICRQLLILLPAAYLLSLTGVLQNVWWSFPIAEIASAIVSTVYLVKINREIISKIGEAA